MTAKAAKTQDAALTQTITREVAKRVVGQEVMVERLMIGLLTGGHILLEGVPGLAKTLAVRTGAECLRISFSRIQFTPDLLPADVVGTMVFDQRSQEFYPKKGPLFANLVLADEINRAPAKVQAALLEAMQEKQVTIGGETFFLGEPFLVLATQSPIEQEGTYPRPEAQLDRFMLKVRVGYRTRDAEKEIVARMASGRPIEVQRIAEAEDILAARSAIAELLMDQKVVDYIVDAVRATREPQAVGLPELKPLIAFGASPRASIYLAQAARAHAYLRGRAFVVPEDVKAMAYDVLRHRVLLTFEAEAEDMDADQVIGKILEAVGVSSAPARSSSWSRGSSSGLAASSTRCSRANTARSSAGRASSSPKCAPTSTATTSARSTGTSRPAWAIPWSRHIWKSGRSLSCSSSINRARCISAGRTRKRDWPSRSPRCWRSRRPGTTTAWGRCWSPIGRSSSCGPRRAGPTLCASSAISSRSARKAAAPISPARCATR